jgi:hypothetical protein
MEPQALVPVTGGGSVVVRQRTVRGRRRTIDRADVRVMASGMRVVVLPVVPVAVVVPVVVVLEELGQRVGIVAVHVRPRAAGVLVIEQGGGRQRDRQREQPRDCRDQ